MGWIAVFFAFLAGSAWISWALHRAACPVNKTASTNASTNPKTRKPGSANCRVSWSQHPELNRRPADYESAPPGTARCRDYETNGVLRGGGATTNREEGEQ